MSKAFVVTAILVLALLPASASPSNGKQPLLRTGGFVMGIAADESRVAAATTGFGVNKCSLVVAWNPIRKTNTRIKTKVACETASAVNRIAEIGMAGKRIAWLEVEGGNYVDLTLRSQVLGEKKALKIADGYNGSGAAEDDSGSYVGNVFGDGNLLVFNSWTKCVALPVDVGEEQTCPNPAPEDGTTVLSKQRLLEVVNGKGVVIASAPDAQGVVAQRKMALTVVAADAGRIATQAPSGEVTLYSAAGDVLKEIAIPSGRFSGFALQGSQLATVRNGNLELYDVDSGSLVKTIPLAAGSVLRDLQKGLAVYVGKRKDGWPMIHVLRLSDGKDVVYSPPGKGPVDAQIEASGLFYSYNYQSGRAPGRVVFVPFARVEKKLG
jgi:hypothetical protein